MRVSGHCINKKFELRHLSIEMTSVFSKKKKESKHLFTQMFSRKALHYAHPFLLHEKMVLNELLSQSDTIENLIVVGSGRNAYYDLAKKYEKKYIGIEPYIKNKLYEIPKFQIITNYFENINRENLGRGSCIFIFWFNVLFYIKNPEMKLNTLLRKGDIIFNSRWANNNSAYSVMEEYFKYVLKGKMINYEYFIKNIIDRSCNLSQLSLLTQKKVVTNRVNSIEIIYTS